MNQIEALNKAAKIAEGAALALLKSHVKGYTRKDGTVVQGHEDSRQVHKDVDRAIGDVKVHHSKLKEGDVLYDKDGRPRDEVVGFRRGFKASDRTIMTRAGYDIQHDKEGFIHGLTNKNPK